MLKFLSFVLKIIINLIKSKKSLLNRIAILEKDMKLEVMEFLYQKQ